MNWFPALVLALALFPGKDANGAVPSAAAMAGAAASLQALLADRPELLALFQSDDEVGTWLTDHFANGGLTIRWSNDQHTLKHYLARHTYTADGHPVIFIARRLKNGSPVSAVAQLSGVVFELLNAEHENDFMALATHARQGEIDRDGFIIANAQIEFAVCRETQQFYREIWRPHLLRNSLRAAGGNWHLGIGDDCGRWIANHREVIRDGYPDDVYGPEYDAIMAQRHAAEKSPAAPSDDKQK